MFQIFQFLYDISFACFLFYPIILFDLIINFLYLVLFCYLFFRFRWISRRNPFFWVRLNNWHSKILFSKFYVTNFVSLKSFRNILNSKKIRFFQYQSSKSNDKSRIMHVQCKNFCIILFNYFDQLDRLDCRY